MRELRDFTRWVGAKGVPAPLEHPVADPAGWHGPCYEVRRLIRREVPP